MNIYLFISIIIIILTIIFILIIYQKVFIKKIEISISINDLLEDTNIDKDKLKYENIKFKWLGYNFELAKNLDSSKLSRQVIFAPMIIDKFINFGKKIKNMLSGNESINISPMNLLNNMIYESDIKLFTDAPKNIKLNLLKRNNNIYLIKLKSKNNENFINSPADNSLIGYQQYDAYFNSVLNKNTKKIIDNREPLMEVHPKYYYNTSIDNVKWI